MSCLKTNPISSVPVVPLLWSFWFLLTFETSTSETFKVEANHIDCERFWCWYSLWIPIFWLVPRVVICQCNQIVSSQITTNPSLEKEISKGNKKLDIWGMTKYFQNINQCEECWQIFAKMDFLCYHRMSERECETCKKCANHQLVKL